YATGALLTAVLTWARFALGLDAPGVLLAVPVGSLQAGEAAWRRGTLPARGVSPDTSPAHPMKAMLRRVRGDALMWGALHTTASPVVDASVDDLAEDVLASDAGAQEDVERAFPEDPGSAAAPDAGEDLVEGEEPGR